VNGLQKLVYKSC